MKVWEDDSVEVTVPGKTPLQLPPGPPCLPLADRPADVAKAGPHPASTGLDSGH